MKKKYKQPEEIIRLDRSVIENINYGKNKQSEKKKLWQKNETIKTTNPFNFFILL